jgi:CBS domain-containing protein
MVRDRRASVRFRKVILSSESGWEVCPWLGESEMTTTVAQLLNQKGHNVEAIAPDAAVYDAIKRMSDLDIGALVVIDAGQVIGIITERDYARNVFLKGKASPTTPVREAMAEEVLSVGRGETPRECMAIMTGKRTRHLLVMEDGELLGILSIGDLVRSIVAEQDMTIDQLEQYIHRG